MFVEHVCVCEQRKLCEPAILSGVSLLMSGKSFMNENELYWLDMFTHTRNLL